MEPNQDLGLPQALPTIRLCVAAYSLIHFSVFIYFTVIENDYL
jgi:hypothetical protein